MRATISGVLVMSRRLGSDDTLRTLLLPMVSVCSISAGDAVGLIFVVRGRSLSRVRSVVSHFRIGLWRILHTDGFLSCVVI